jgi:hypothetical protein
MNAPDSPLRTEPRAYKVSRERLIAFKALTAAQRLQWVEESAAFLRLARTSRE